MSIDLLQLATANPTILSGLNVEQVLNIHPLLDAQELPFIKARKVVPIKARPINTILDKSDQVLSVWDKMLLVTLEGNQALKRNSFVCWGINNDVWQQTAAKLHAKYTPTEVDADGWTTFVPKEGADSVMDAYQITDDMGVGPYGGFSVTNPTWGDERVVDGRTLNLHYGIVGDWVLRNPNDLVDVYRVAKAFFEATYTIE